MSAKHSALLVVQSIDRCLLRSLSVLEHRTFSHSAHCRAIDKAAEFPTTPEQAVAEEQAKPSERDRAFRVAAAMKLMLENTSMREWADRERLEVARILQQHQTLVRGGQEEGLRLVDALLGWKAAANLPADVRLPSDPAAAAPEGKSPGVAETGEPTEGSPQPESEDLESGSAFMVERGKWIFYGCTTIGEMIQRMDERKAQLQELLADGWELRQANGDYVFFQDLERPAAKD